MRGEKSVLVFGEETKVQRQTDDCTGLLVTQVFCVSYKKQLNKKKTYQFSFLRSKKYLFY